ncbi:MAG: aspartate carbamoyltransferase regulatory subunit [bacterium P3]|nr:MAG: aspartate carbamoyltransferase regulatory subunit [bacterium P3]KWW40668.1 MAG: aspartate carbamoyltransferase regulatory subunit [bacterium F083]
MDSKKELVVPRIENGTVIDHIPTVALYQVIHILGLEKYQDQVLIGNYLNSMKLGKKGIIKINNKHFTKEEISKIALVAPFATIIDIKDFAVTDKFTTEIPDHVENFVKCANPKCITNSEQIATRFDIVDKVNLKLKCHYCEKFTTKDTLVINEK